mmetsp:Transcript_53043/g.103783  ORF Transcript_53043/g.103783 Transcript_53043/m.103783 type:complete len:218 (-) Transcript_53043:958-1611(-)
MSRQTVRDSRVPMELCNLQRIQFLDKRRSLPGTFRVRQSLPFDQVQKLSASRFHVGVHLLEAYVPDCLLDGCRVLAEGKRLSAPLCVVLFLFLSRSSGLRCGLFGSPAVPGPLAVKLVKETPENFHLNVHLRIFSVVGLARSPDLLDVRPELLRLGVNPVVQLCVDLSEVHGLFDDAGIPRGVSLLFHGTEEGQRVLHPPALEDRHCVQNGDAALKP